MARVLVIDDEESVREIVKRILELKGHEVFGAENGLEGIKRAKAMKPDLIILDIRMPEMDGYVVSEHLKFHPEFSHIPILMLTAMQDEKSRQYAEETAIDAYMTKPFDRETLTTKVEEMLKRKSVRVGQYHQSFEVKRRSSLIYFPIALAVVIMILAMIPSLLHYATPDDVANAGSAAGAAGKPMNLSQRSDMIFMIAAPVAMFLVLYQTWLLTKIAGDGKKDRDRR